MGEYTLLTLISLVVVVGLELAVFRTGIFRMPVYWLSMVIVLGFQIPVDGWLTKLSAPIVLYNADETTGIRAPWDIPIEDFGFGFSMVTLTLILWIRAKRAHERAGARADAGSTR
ncbi:MAG: lycopene cyclase domain-containing protein [Propionibacteriaceae bacterium]|nr:lycopene cyclase domain-containing protein [Propionibacteriaceae bacterium]